MQCVARTGTRAASNINVMASYSWSGLAGTSQNKSDAQLDKLSQTITNHVECLRMLQRPDCRELNHSLPTQAREPYVAHASCSTDKGTASPSPTQVKLSTYMTDASAPEFAAAIRSPSVFMKRKQICYALPPSRRIHESAIKNTLAN